MYKLTILFALVACIPFAGNTFAQDNAQKTKDLVAALDKTKYKKKEKASISIELYVDIRNEPALRAELTEYSGRYESDGYQLLLTVKRDGSAKGSGYDSFTGGDETLEFQLKDARVDGALIQGTKVYKNGVEQPFEAVFVNRTSRAGTNPKIVTAESTQFGIGFIQYGNAAIGQCDPDKTTTPDNKNASVTDMANKEAGWTNRVFLERK